MSTYDPYQHQQRMENTPPGGISPAQSHRAPYPPHPYPPQGWGPPPPPRRRRWARRHPILTGLLTVLIVIVAASAAAVAHAPGETSAGHNGTITYVVTGHGSADVTYGPSGTDLAGRVPMRVTTKIGSPDYYAIQAQLNGGGRVTVEILINGKLISQGTATGSYNIAMAEITQDPLTGDWTDSQSG